MSDDDDGDDDEKQQPPERSPDIVRPIGQRLSPGPGNEFWLQNSTKDSGIRIIWTREQ